MPAPRKKHRVATFERLLHDAMSGHPEISRDEFLDALRDRYREFLRARRKPPSIPPHA
jgi:hypothetical protein